MVITGYRAGTEVKWNEDQSIATGTIEQVFRESQVVEVDGDQLHVEVSDNSPTYLVRHHNTGAPILIAHRSLFRRHMNEHT